MSISVCDVCGHFYALELRSGPGRVCPDCSGPLRVIRPADARALAAARQGQNEELGRWPLRPGTAPRCAASDTVTAPEAEIAGLNRTVTGARSLAEKGQVASGFMSLAQGLQHACDEEDSGASWGQGLAQLYREAMERYAHHYGLL